MAKKKKTQLKPVARGFATVSVPKKVVHPKETEGEVGLSNTSGEYVPANVGKAGIVAEDTEKVAVPDPKQIEEQDLQSLIDRLQDKTEKEIVRTIKNIETDRSFSNTFSRLELDPLLIDQIITLVKEKFSTEKAPLDDPRDKALARLGITYGVLRRLGFSEDRVEQCLRSINGVELEEAYDWLYVYCSEAELSLSGGNELAKKQRIQSGKSSRRSEMPLTLPDGSVTSTSTQKTKEVEERTQARFDARMPSPAVIDRVVQGQPSNTKETDEESDSEDPNPTYVRLKLRLDIMLNERKFYSDAEIKAIRSRLAGIEQDLLFDERKATELYNKQRDNALLAKLRGSALSTPASVQPTKTDLSKTTSANETPELRPPSSSNSDIFDDADSDASGPGLLELLETPATGTTVDGKVVAFKDMALPKHYTGPTPKRLLKEAVARKDRYAVITYTLISGTSRATRSSVCIRWEGKQAEEWSMDDVACADQNQAEHYIALVALHSLTFPRSIGFAASNPSDSGNPTFFRSLPPSFRDLWDELEDARKSNENFTNRQIWSELQSLLEPKISAGGKVATRVLRANPERRNEIPPSITGRNGRVGDRQRLLSAYRAMQDNPMYQEMLLQRRNLPIARYRENILDTLDRSQVLVLSGETGCGKSTQVPSFILEDSMSKGKPCKIYCTEPRRISSISLAQRVSRELGEPPNVVGTNNSLVGYAIRLESNITKSTRLAYVTNGIALRMLEGDSGSEGATGFDELTHIIIDEVHERTIESDFLLIVLKSLLCHRPDIRIILMSATVDADKISQYFGGCPTLHVPGRTFPVEVYYLEDALEYTHWTITEGSPYAKRLRDKFNRRKEQYEWTEEAAVADDDDIEESAQENIKFEKQYSPETIATLNVFDERLIPYDLILLLLQKICFEDPTYQRYSAAILIFVPGLGEIRRINDMLNDHSLFGSEDLFQIYPLHSTLSSENQNSVFELPPPGVRKIVIATNIAETGITIPDITCVIDTGKHREMRFDEKRQISRLVEVFIAKSNAAQRRGRAGRVQQGLCFHLFTRFRHDNQMVDNPLPEMMRLSLADLALRIKILRIKLGPSIEDVLSQALDPPSAVNVQRAISMLVEVRALTPAEEITPMGRLLSKLPTDVHLGKFLLIATLLRCLDPALTIAATLNSKSPFVTPLGLETEAERAKAAFRMGDSDFLTIHNAFVSWRKASANPGFTRKFCRTNFLSHQSLQQIEELRQQFLSYLIDSSFIQVDRSVVRELNRARWTRGKTRFVSVPSELDVNSVQPSLVNAALVAGLYPKVLYLDREKMELRTITSNQVVSVHPSSVNFNRKLTDVGCSYFTYFTIMRSKRLYAWEIGPVDDLALILLCGDSEFRPISNMVTIDRNKIRFRIPQKSNIALKYLRTSLNNILAQRFRGKRLDEKQLQWEEIGIRVLGRIKANDEDTTSIGVRV